MNLDDELVFVPLGGLGEIGMNAALYGFGPPERDNGSSSIAAWASAAKRTFRASTSSIPICASSRTERENLLGIFITHAHEDHIGALVDLWPAPEGARLRDALRDGLLATRACPSPGRPRCL